MNEIKDYEEKKRMIEVSNDRFWIRSIGRDIFSPLIHYLPWFELKANVSGANILYLSTANKL